MDNKLSFVQEILEKQKSIYKIKGIAVFIGKKGRRVDFMAENSYKVWMVRWLGNKPVALAEPKEQTVERFWNKWAAEGNLWVACKKPNTMTIQTDRGRIFATLVRDLEPKLKKV